MDVLNRLITDFQQASTGLELALLALCLALAFVSSYWIGRGHQAHSVWFGRHTVDGVLFPVLALAFAYGARAVLARYQPVFVLDIAVPVLLALALIRLCARVLTLAFPRSGTIRIVERVLSWFVWLAAVLWILDLLPLVVAELERIELTFGRTRVSLRTIIEGALSSLLVLVAALWAASALEERVLNDAVKDLSVRKLASNVLRAFLLFIGLLFALSAVGVDLTALSVMGGAVGVGLGFGLQKLASNYVSGFVMLLERSLRIGDNVRVDGFEGRITDITTRYTRVRASNGRESIVPNELFIIQRVENLSIQDQRCGISSTIVVAADSDIALVQSILAAAAQPEPRVLAEPPPVAYLSAFAPDGLEFSLNYWIQNPDTGLSALRSAIHIRMLEGLRAAGVRLAQPERLLHVRHLPAGPQPDASEAAR